MKQYNEKPSKYSNIGEDIKGAKRHNFDTYENPDVVREKAVIKQAKVNIERHKEEAIETMTEENFRDVLTNFEFMKMCENINEVIADEYTEEYLAIVRSNLRHSRGGDNHRLYVRRFNAFLTIRYKIKWRLTYEQAQTYFEKKKKKGFKEFNGVQQPWKLTAGGAIDPVFLVYLTKKTKGVQFGNSLKESEREYCIQNLALSLMTLEKHLSFDFSTIAFSYGARGIANSIAHYQDSKKVLAFNRGWDGALIHELGHAIDYSLGRVCSGIPRQYLRDYVKQLKDAKTDPMAMRYYASPVEVFARLFEVYMIELLGKEMTTFMQCTFSEEVMPKLTPDITKFMNGALAPILRLKL